MRQTTWVLATIVATLFGTMAYAGFQALDGSGAQIGSFGAIECGTGLTCTRDGKYFKLVSSPTLTGTSLVLSSTLEVDSDFSVATNKFNVTAASGNTAVAGTLNSVGNFSVATNKLTVAAASGNTVVAGTLGVTSDVAVNTNKFNVTASSGNTTVAGTLGITGATTFTGGVTVANPKVNWGTWRPSALTSGTSTQASSTTVYVAQITIEHNTTLTGIKVNNAATVGTNKYIVALFNSAGTALANSSLSGVTTSGADSYQTIPFTGTYAVVGPGVYWIAVYMNGTTDRFRTVPAVGEYAGLAGSVSGQTFGTVASLTLPTTFSADLGPVAFTY